jgi:hypothetical protein
VFTAWGGTLVVEGLEIADTVEHNGRSVMLNVGDEGVGQFLMRVLELSPGR